MAELCSFLVRQRMLTFAFRHAAVSNRIEGAQVDVVDSVFMHRIETVIVVSIPLKKRTQIWQTDIAVRIEGRALRNHAPDLWT